MNKPVLVVMAAGMGSRYGGLKQMDPMDDDGHIIMDFSLYDAKKAGFEQVLFIIQREDEQAFKEVVGDRMGKQMDVSYVYQDLASLPVGYSVPEGRKKPWGTGHAILCCLGQIEGPFAVINADDYYGVHAFSYLYDYLSTHPDDAQYQYVMVGYQLKNTVTDNGHVSRGICQVNGQGELLGVRERTWIVKTGEGIACSEDEGKTLIPLPEDAIVSMNMWGFTESILEELRDRFPSFLEQGLRENPLKCEYFLPAVVSDLLEERKARVQVLPSQDSWYGVTYRQDKPVVVEAIQQLKQQGVYPEHLWN